MLQEHKCKEKRFRDFIAELNIYRKTVYFPEFYGTFCADSNSGLLVGATMTMRPDLLEIAFPGVNCS